MLDELTRYDNVAVLTVSPYVGDRGEESVSTRMP